MSIHWIYQKYKDLATDIRKGYTLKTDAWQEHKGDDSAIEADVYLEILPHVAERAIELGHNVIIGTVCDMPFDDNTFDTLIDTSTIDHVKDYDQVLKEYHRVLKPTGDIMVVVWTTPQDTKDSGADAAGGIQYHFNEAQFVEAYQKYFTITDRQVLWPITSTEILMYYKGEPRLAPNK